MFILCKTFLFAFMVMAHLSTACLVSATKNLLTGMFTKLFASFEMALHSCGDLVNNFLLHNYFLLNRLSLCHHRLSWHWLPRCHHHRLSRHWLTGHHHWLSLSHHHWLAWRHHHWLTRHGLSLSHHNRHRWRKHPRLSVHWLLHHYWLSLNLLHLYLLLLFFIYHCQTVISREVIFINVNIKR